jgi:hypothetical protein
MLASLIMSFPFPLIRFLHVIKYGFTEQGFHVFTKLLWYVGTMHFVGWLLGTNEFEGSYLLLSRFESAILIYSKYNHMLFAFSHSNSTLKFCFRGLSGFLLELCSDAYMSSYK